MVRRLVTTAFVVVEFPTTRLVMFASVEKKDAIVPVVEKSVVEVALVRVALVAVKLVKIAVTAFKSDVKRLDDVAF